MAQRMRSVPMLYHQPPGSCNPTPLDTSLTEISHRWTDLKLAGSELGLELDSGPNLLLLLLAPEHRLLRDLFAGQLCGQFIAPPRQPIVSFLQFDATFGHHHWASLIVLQNRHHTRRITGVNIVGMLLLFVTISCKEHLFSLISICNKHSSKFLQLIQLIWWNGARCRRAQSRRQSRIVSIETLTSRE